jgi:hypothetical protein
MTDKLHGLAGSAADATLAMPPITAATERIRIVLSFIASFLRGSMMEAKRASGRLPEGFTPRFNGNPGGTNEKI